MSAARVTVVEVALVLVTTTTGNDVIVDVVLVEVVLVAVVTVAVPVVDAWVQVVLVVLCVIMVVDVLHDVVHDVVVAVVHTMLVPVLCAMFGLIPARKTAETSSSDMVKEFGFSRRTILCPFFTLRPLPRLPERV